MQRTDAVVVGGGLTGLAAAVAVAGAGLETVHLAPVSPRDQRTSALMQPSVDYLKGAGLVDEPAALGHPLTRMRLIDATGRLLRAPEALFDSAEAGLEAFGWNFANVKLTDAFEAAGAGLANLSTVAQAMSGLELTPDGPVLTLADGSRLRAPLVVGADGKKSLVRASAGFRAREHGFEQSALVCDLELGRPIGGTSVEFHYPNGPFTLVPAGGNRANLVWIDDRDVLKAAQAGGEERLRAALLEKSQRLFGDIRLATAAFIFPLSTLSVDRAGADGVVLVGEAAHAFPPIGAQGLNLGLRDVADLAAALAAESDRTGNWAVRLSEDYAARRQADLARTGMVVDVLFRSLLSPMLPAQMLRAAGLWALKLLPPLRRQAFAQGMGVR
ncbi:FAD-dependent monooxygenase [Devosia sp.]|uniref:FAD-dependent monooxygenase n=1 Tax=Devosia sp. TaxID=1871048 RepID=UPI002F1BF7D6